MLQISHSFNAVLAHRDPTWRTYYENYVKVRALREVLKGWIDEPRHWSDPATFDPDRYLSAPTSHEIDTARTAQMGFAQRPFEADPFDVKDGRPAALQSSGFGTVFGVVDGQPQPVCDYAGYAPFGFGYRRCPGELLTIGVFSDFLKAVWQRKIEFEQLDITDPVRLPVGPGAVIADTIGFRPAAA